MWFLGKVEFFVFSTTIITIACSAPNPEKCSQAEKVYYGTYKFAVCSKKQALYWCHKGETGWNEFKHNFFKESDPDHYKEGSNCSGSGYSTSCEYLRFISQVCGSHYKVCHTEQERKPIMKMWIKQFIRETVYRDGGFQGFEDDALELKNGECNDILEKYFDKEEIAEISDMIGPADSHWKYRHYSNVTISPMGVLAKADKSGRMPIPENSKIYKYLKSSTIDNKGITLPSHWKYCDWKLTQSFKENHEYYVELPNLWRCDGKCNSNAGDDQAWYKTNPFEPGSYMDLNDGRFIIEDYMDDLIIKHDAENATDLGIYGCHIDTVFGDPYDCQRYQNDCQSYQRYQNLDCQRYQNFIKYCLDPIDRCLGNIAIREVVLAAIVRDFKPETCWENVSKANYLEANFMLTLLFILFHIARYSM